ncbi:MAG TPA: T9SS type A sorting domain-containing protein, partial [Candidatus Kapabacteria bacterium]|nr:T9SS type A sorting domain-containing protein [Candidatus Kapabacteria bacterium]
QNHFNTQEDTVRPWIVAKFDDKTVKNGDYISNSPLISVELYDNSLLPVMRQNDLQIRINGVMQTPERTKYYQLETFGNTRPLKARLTIIPDTLRESDNSVLIYFSDASSNRDTVKYFLKIAINGEIRDYLIYPNPSKFRTNLKLYLLSPENNQSFTINIFNSYGQKIRQFNFNSTIGENTISFDNFDEQGNLLPNGVYFYSIISNNSIYYDPVFGKFLINY